MSLPANTVDPFALPSGGEGFAPATVTARVLQTAASGNRVVISSEQIGPNTQSFVKLYSGAEVNDIAPFELLNQQSGGASVGTLLAPASNGGSRIAQIQMVGESAAVGTFTNISVFADVFGAVATGQLPIGFAGSVPMISAFSAPTALAGVNYNGVKWWPIEQYGHPAGVTDGSGNMVVTFPVAYPNGLGIVLPFANLIALNFYIAIIAYSLTGFTVQLRNAVTNAVVPAQALTVSWKAVGW